MFELRDYTYAEMKEILKISDVSEMKKKLERLEIVFDTSGRGKKVVFNIREILNPFKLFCHEKLGVNLQTSFEKFATVLHYMYNDEFRILTTEDKSKYLEEKGYGVSKDTIPKYYKILEKNEWISYRDGGYDVTYCYLPLESGKKKISREEYGRIWSEGFEETKATDKNDLRLYRYFQEKYGGTPKKVLFPLQNEIYKKELDELQLLADKYFKEKVEKNDKQ